MAAEAEPYVEPISSVVVPPRAPINPQQPSSAVYFKNPPQPQQGPDTYPMMVIPESKTVFIRGVISKKTSEDINQAILTLTSAGDVAYILIDSDGGDIYAGRQIIDAIQAANGPVYTICLNYCASMAAFIFQYGSVRIMTPGSTLMYHPAYGTVKGNIDTMVTEAIAIKNYIDPVERFVAKRIGMSFKTYKYESAVNNIYVDANQAEARKFADSVYVIYYSY